MLGTVRYERCGRFTLDLDNDVTPDYAEAVSRRTEDVVEWCSSNDPNDVRWYYRGQRVIQRRGS